MSVFLCSSDDGLNGREAAAWVPVASNAACPPRYRVLPNLAKRLEQAFTESRDIWWQLARELQATPSAHLAHAVSCNPGPSDLGTMLAWSRLVDQLAADRQNYIVRCDDPWLFRHLATRPGVTGDSAPPLLGRRLRLLARGYFSRIGVAAAACREHLRHRAGKARMPAGRAAIVVYGHPRSDADGGDAYFADLMARIPDVVRLLHTDCRGPLGTELAAHRRTVSLHAWGRLRSVAALPFARWRPSPRERSSTYGWLVRRAADLEAATGTGAQLSWQAACQSRWLSETRPRAVAWPWENHTWERSLVSAARQVGAATFGYQHTVVGHHMYNLSPAALVDGEQDLPDRIIANGPLFVDDMERLGVPKGRIQMGGALRFTIDTHGADNYDPDGAVYVALPSARSVVDEIVDAVAEAAGMTYSRRRIGAFGRRF